jgi:hypothetical protein
MGGASAEGGAARVTGITDLAPPGARLGASCYSSVREERDVERLLARRPRSTDLR